MVALKEKSGDQQDHECLLEVVWESIQHTSVLHSGELTDALALSSTASMA